MLLTPKILIRLGIGLGCAALLCSATAGLAETRDKSELKPVRVVADRMMRMSIVRADGTQASVKLPLYLSLDWTKPQPEVVRALLVFHGLHRSAESANAAGLEAIRHAGEAGKGTLLIAPRFLAQVDIDAHHPGADVLRWTTDSWSRGDNALNAAISPFDALDLILAQLADQKIFSNLKSVVLAGHSAGGQLVQRYAAVGRGGEMLIKNGVRLRYVVANPSSYVYFSAEWPAEQRVLSPGRQGGSHSRFRGRIVRGYNRWKCGMEDLPDYAHGARAEDMEQRYVRRDVIYLLGTADDDPAHPELDISCAGEAEGPYRLFRGEAYFAYLAGKHPELRESGARQQLWLVPGIGHDAKEMFHSACGEAALFDAGSCGTRVLSPQP